MRNGKITVRFPAITAGLWFLGILLGCGTPEQGNQEGQNSISSGNTVTGLPEPGTGNPFSSYFRRQDFRQEYNGNIGSDIPVKLDLSIRKGDIKGSFGFTKTQKTAFADGSLNHEGEMKIKVIQDGKEVGILNGIFVKHGYIEGEYISLSGGEAMPFFLADKTANINFDPAQHGKTAGEIYDMRHDVYCDNCECLLKFHYPQVFAGPLHKKEAIESINRDIRVRMQTLNNLKCQLISSWKIPIGVSNYETKLLDAQLLSVQFYGMGQNENGDSLLAFRGSSYSLESGERLEMEDLFSSVPAVLSKVNAKKPSGFPYMGEAGTGHNFDFYLRESGIVFFYSRIGDEIPREAEISLSFQELSGLIKAGSPLDSYLNNT